MNWLGLDIGGANLKTADGLGWARSVPFLLWREPDKLAAEMGALIESAPAADRLAITMTGELCDSFRTKADGVRYILAAAQHASADCQVRVYLVDGRFASVDEARELPHLAAASNWHALAQFACRFAVGGPGLLVDIGSTTTDIVPLVDGQPRAVGLNDTDRLLTGELVYSGVTRTPICALTRWLPWRGAQCPVAAELFATTADAYVTLGELPEQPDCTTTVDGRPLTRQFAHERLARMVCADRETFSNDDARRAAEHVRNSQVAQLNDAFRQVVDSMSLKPEWIAVSGAGEFLANALARSTCPKANCVSLSERIGRAASDCGPAHAIAVLARERGETLFV